MQVPGVGAFVRALLAVNLTDGHRLTFGVWLAIDPSRFFEVFEVWRAPAYADLELDGRLANAIPPRGLLAAPVHAVVREPGHTPYCDTSTEPVLTAVLHNEWPHEPVLAAVTA